MLLTRPPGNRMTKVEASMLSNKISKICYESKRSVARLSILLLLIWRDELFSFDN